MPAKTITPQYRPPQVLINCPAIGMPVKETKGDECVARRVVTAIVLNLAKLSDAGLGSTRFLDSEVSLDDHALILLCCDLPEPEAKPNKSAKIMIRAICPPAGNQKAKVDNRHRKMVITIALKRPILSARRPGK